MSSTGSTNSTTATLGGPDDVAAAKTAAMQALLAYLKENFYLLQVFLLSGYGIMFALSVTLIVYLRYNRNVALRGDADAARKIILPAFEPLLWILGMTTGCYTVFFCSVLATSFYSTDISKLATECFYSGRQFVFVIVIVFMLQKSVSIPALQRTVVISFFLSTYTVPIVWYLVTYVDPVQFYWTITISRALLLGLYSYVLIKPPSRASKRSLSEFCVFAYVYYTFLFLYNEMFHSQHNDLGFNLTYVNLIWGSMCPLVIWRVLKADTEYWRGMGQRAVALQSIFRQKHHINEHISSQGLHVLIEMHRKYIIDFAYLELQERIGVGASAIVFRGILHSETPVAVKVYTPSDFTEDTVAEFSHEAALCGALHHPNIVRFYGMCVFPPTICLVSELCQGSLDDVTIAIASREQNPERQQFLINLGYMIDAARAVAYIHSFSPAFLHRDIKPANFLVDGDSNVKLTDFGESRSIPRAHIEKNAMNITKQPATRPEFVAGVASKLQRIESTGFLELSSIIAPSPSTAIVIETPKSERSEQVPEMTVKGTVDYMAPEVIQGRAGLANYGEAADVYSLAITMWDILHPGTEKYPLAGGNQFKILELVLEGVRPSLEAHLHASFREVIEGAWNTDPRMRPSAHNIVHILESIHEEVAAVLALQVYDELGHHDQSQKRRTHGENIFSGQQIVTHLEAQGLVNSHSEAIRVGHALMDTGLLHHVKHCQPFEGESDVHYFFDEEAIRFCHPIAFLEPISQEVIDQSSGEQKKHAVSISAGSRPKTSIQLSSSSHTTNPPNKLNAATTSQSRLDRTSSQSIQFFTENGLCLCRKLGQRLETSMKKASCHHHHHNFRKKFSKKKNIKDEKVNGNLLTAKLLRQEENRVRVDDELSGFDTLAESLSPSERV
uniref:Protein kinase domain-containing protein n=1 Tax=Globisporangium ultimum (strain ATCC 200006 / CBS 805.95 / DAOM BR144) TaxID=431595 RepID=K3X2A3_GLOUD